MITVQRILLIPPPRAPLTTLRSIEPMTELRIDLSNDHHFAQRLPDDPVALADALIHIGVVLRQYVITQS